MSHFDWIWLWVILTTIVGVSVHGFVTGRKNVEAEIFKLKAKNSALKKKKDKWKVRAKSQKKR